VNFVQAVTDATWQAATGAQVNSSTALLVHARRVVGHGCPNIRCMAMPGADQVPCSRQIQTCTWRARNFADCDNYWCAPHESWHAALRCCCRCQGTHKHGVACWHMWAI